MRPNIEQPTVTEQQSPGGTKSLRYDHPAYAQISINRVSGSATLYGSDFAHQNFVRLKITKSSLRRDLSNDTAMADVGTYVEVDMSEAQFASLVTSLNTGSGTQCTLRYLDGKPVAYLPLPQSREDQFKAEVQAACADALAALVELRAAVNDTKLSQKAKDELTATANRIESRLLSSLPFVLDQFGEHMEQTVEKAKTEINGYLTSAALQAGRAALAGSGVEPLKLSGSNP